jgi:3-hydroxyisobutyrate dehydrogenase-like beta-hydroxyacid dehydrogenase
MVDIAFLGTGAMGGRMAGRLLDVGHRLVVWNRTPARTADLVARGASRADTPGEAAARAELVITMLADPSALREVTEGPDGVLAGVRPGTTLVEMSTVGLDAVRRLSTVLPDGVDLMDAPVLGSLSEAEAGKLRVFVGGQNSLAERWAPVLSGVGTPMHVGPLGSGAAAKLVVNSTLFGVLAVLGEALALADGLGLSRDVAFEVLSETPVGAQADRRRPAVMSGEFPLRFTMALARKDADLVTTAAEEAGLRLPVASAAGGWVADGVAAGRGDQDYSAVLAHIIAASRT